MFIDCNNENEKMKKLRSNVGLYMLSALFWLGLLLLSLSVSSNGNDVFLRITIGVYSYFKAQRNVYKWGYTQAIINGYLSLEKGENSNEISSRGTNQD